MLKQRAGKGFTLLELAAVVAILAILLAIGIPNLVRLQANNRINAAAERLEGEFQQAQKEARGFGFPQTRAGVTPFLVQQVAGAAGGPWVALQISRQQPNQAATEVLKRWYIGPIESYPVTMTDIPSAPLGNAGDVGLVLEIGDAPRDGGAINVTAAIPIQPDGSFVFPAGVQTAADLDIGTPEHGYRIRLHPSGKVERSKL